MHKSFKLCRVEISAWHSRLAGDSADDNFRGSPRKPRAVARVSEWTACLCSGPQSVILFDHFCFLFLKKKKIIIGRLRLKENLNQYNILWRGKLSHYHLIVTVLRVYCAWPHRWKALCVSEVRAPLWTEAIIQISGEASPYWTEMHISSAAFIMSNEQKPKLLQCEQFVVIQCFITLRARCPHFHLVSSTFKWISISIMLLVSAHDAIIVNSMSFIISKFTLFPHKPNIPQTHQSISKPIQLSV